MTAPVRIIFTGHPPPLRQVADQLRTSSGVTFAPGGVQRPPAARQRPYAAEPLSLAECGAALKNLRVAV